LKAGDPRSYGYPDYQLSSPSGSPTSKNAQVLTAARLCNAGHQSVNSVADGSVATLYHNRGQLQLAGQRGIACSERDGLYTICRQLPKTGFKLGGGDAIASSALPGFPPSPAWIPRPTTGGRAGLRDRKRAVFVKASRLGFVGPRRASMRMRHTAPRHGRSGNVKDAAGGTDFHRACLAASSARTGGDHAHMWPK